jgi:endonuclease YncB( thermonuclease family)
MAGLRFSHSGARHGGRSGRQPLFLVMVSLVCLTAFYALGRRHVERARIEDRTPIVGYAWIVDGDSIRIRGISIRLQGIDAPEWDQSCTDAEGRAWLCGRAATRQLKERTRGQQLTCRPSARDRYGRVLAACSLQDGTELNAWMVREGWAVAFSFTNAYAWEETQARAAKRGIWAGSFVSPAEWRRQKSGGRHRFGRWW